MRWARLVLPLLLSVACKNPPGAPTGMLAVFQSGHVIVTFNTVSGATSYVVGRRSLTSSQFTSLGPPSQPGAGAQLRYDDSNVPSGTYVYAASARNDDGWGPLALSNPVAVTSVSKPTISSFTANPSSVASGGSTTLSWTVGGTFDSIRIDPGAISETSASGTQLVSNLTATTTFTLTAANSGGTSTATATVTVTGTTGPSATITAPASGATLSGPVTVTATASDTATLTKVEIYLDGLLQQTCTSPVTPCNWSWDTTTAANGSHSLFAKAYDSASAVGTSGTVSVTVQNGTTPGPTTAILGPNSSTVFGVVTVEVAASQGVISVDLLVDGVGWPSGPCATTFGCYYAWDTSVLPAGVHTIQGKGYDAKSNVGTSPLVNVNVVRCGSDAGIVNGNFESGGFGGWTLNAGSVAVVDGGPFGTHGIYDAQLGLATPTGDSSISQSFTAPPDGGVLGLWFNIVCGQFLGAPLNDYATATLLDNTTGVTTNVLQPVCPFSPTVGDGGIYTDGGNYSYIWQMATGSLTGSHNYTLTLRNHDDNNAADPTYTVYDDVGICVPAGSPDAGTDAGIDAGPPVGPGTFAIGGTPATSTVEFYSSGANSWSTMTPMPTARYQLAAARVTIAGDAGVLAVGGINTAPLATAEFYNPAANSWTAMTPMPTALDSLAAAPVTIGAVPGVLAVGGYGGGGIVPTAAFYNPNANSWSPMAPMATGRYYLAAAPVTIGGAAGVLALGGTDGGPAAPTAEFYNPSTNSWTMMTPMPTARLELAAVPVTIAGDAGVLAIGGQGAAGFLQTAEFYNPSTNSWTMVAPMPTARGYLAAALVTIAGDAGVLAVGGSGTASSQLSTAEFYNPNTNSWSTIAPMPTPRYGLVAGP